MSGRTPRQGDRALPERAALEVVDEVAVDPSQGRCRHFHTPLYMALVILRTKRIGRRGNGFTARG